VQRGTAENIRDRDQGPGRLTGDEDIFAKAQTLAADIETREGYEARLKSAVDACRP